MVKKNINYWLMRGYRKLFVKPILFNRTYAIFHVDHENNLQWEAGNFWLLSEAKKAQKEYKKVTIIMKIYND